MSSKLRRARSAAQFGERLEPRRLLAAQVFPGQGPVVGAYPTAVVAADFNNDGKTDLATANYNDGTVSIVRSNGDGTFAAAITVAVGSSPKGLAAGDFNHDGKVDLVAVHSPPVGANTLSVLIGQGDGNFAAAVSYAAGTSSPATAGAATVADVNGDTHPDLLVASATNTSGTISVLLGTGSGTFGAATLVAVGTYPTALATGDFNADGKVDIAAAGASAVSVLIGNGNGTFAASANYAATQPDSVVVGDFNEDGKPDLAVASYGSTVSTLLGNGLGAFAAATPFPAVATTATKPESIVTGDFNADGHADLATANEGHTVSVLLGSGANAFNPPIVYDVGLLGQNFTVGRCLATADVNGDGRLDLAVATRGESYGFVSVLAGVGNGTFLASKSSAVAGTPLALATADFNADGIPDVVTAANNGTNLSVLIGNGDGAFTATALAGSYGALDVTAGDFNGDGKADFATANGNSQSVTIFLGNGNGAFAAPATVAVASGTYKIVTADFNGDAKADLAAIGYGGGTIAVLLGNGGGGFAAEPGVTPGGSYYSIAVADWNRDGKPDLAVGRYGSPNAIITVLGGNGDGSFYTAASVAAAGFQAVAAADFNNDNKPDLVTANGNAGAANPGSVSVALGNGDGSFAPAATFPAGYATTNVVAADFDGDGKPDLAASSSADNAVVVLPGNGNGTFAPFTTAAVGGFSPFGLVAADFNGDGRTDVATSNDDSNGSVTVLPNRPNGVYLGIGGGSVTLSGTGPVTINKAGGVLSITTPRGTRQVAAAAVTRAVLSGVTATITADLGPATGNGIVNVTVDTAAAVTFNTSQHLAGLTASGTAAFAAGGGKVLRTPALTLNAIGRLDLSDNDLVYDYSGATAQAAAVRGLIASARAGGAWTGFGLTSTAAKNRPAATLGYMEATDYQSINGPAATFDGEALDATAVVVKYTINGDADFSGRVDFNDFLRLQAGFAQAGNFAQGDFNYDGRVDFNDFLVLQANFGAAV